MLIQLNWCVGFWLSVSTLNHFQNFLQEVRMYDNEKSSNLSLQNLLLNTFTGIISLPSFYRYIHTFLYGPDKSTQLVFQVGLDPAFLTPNLAPIPSHQCWAQYLAHRRCSKSIWWRCDFIVPYSLWLQKPPPHWRTWNLVSHREGYVAAEQPLSCVRLFVTPWAAACPTFLSFTTSWNLLKLMSIEVVIAIKPSHPLSERR